MGYNSDNIFLYVPNLFFIDIAFHLSLYYLVTLFHVYISVLVTLDKTLLGHVKPFQDHLQIS